MTDLPLGLRHEMDQAAEVGMPEVLSRQSAGDGTVKLLMRLQDGSTVEAVSMLYRLDRSRDRLTFCLSSQVGCPIGCPFCATGKSGFVRNLTAGEIVGQALVLLEEAAPGIGDAEKIGVNIVFMGMGEPLLNLEEVLKAGRLLHDPEGMGISWRRITISTSGVVPGIRSLMGEGLPINLAVSLHAADNRLRDRLVPINRRYPLEELIPACREYADAGGRRMTFEYVLLPGINDKLEQACQLAELLAGLPALVNLIPVNPAGEEEQSGSNPADAKRAREFARVLKGKGIGATIREGKGGEIMAACGQLRSREVRER